MSYTPGPWHHSDCTVYALNDRNTNRFSALVQAAGKDCATEHECKANARLIAAAPELVEALEAVLREWGQSSRIAMQHESEAVAQALLRRIKGE